MAKGKVGRPRFEFTEERIDIIRELASEGATVKELARAVGCSVDTLYANSTAIDAYHQGQADMKISLRHWQFLQAKSGNVQMLIWLGRNILGQKDQPIQDSTEEKREDDPLTKSLKEEAERLENGDI